MKNELIVNMSKTISQYDYMKLPNYKSVICPGHTKNICINIFFNVFI